MAVFVGTHTMKIDGKGRVSMPAAFRDVLAKSGAPEAMLMPTEGSPVIEGCDRAYVDELVGRLYTPGAMSESGRERVMLMLGEMVTLSIDPEGRFVFPAALRTLGAIEDTVLFVGQGRTFQLWHPSKHQEDRQQRKAKLGGEKLSLGNLFFAGEGSK